MLTTKFIITYITWKWRLTFLFLVDEFVSFSNMANNIAYKMFNKKWYNVTVILQTSMHTLYYISWITWLNYGSVSMYSNCFVDVSIYFGLIKLISCSKINKTKAFLLRISWTNTCTFCFLCVCQTGQNAYN